MGEVCVKVLGDEIVFSEQMNLFNSLRKKFWLLSKEVKEKVNRRFDEAIDSYTSYVENCQEVMDDLFDEYLQIGVLDLISYGIYDIDEVVLRQEFEKDADCGYRDALFKTMGMIQGINMQQARADEARKEIIAESGSTIQGSIYGSSGDFKEDVGNIIEGELENAAINALFAGGAALVTGGIRSVEKKFAEKEKQAVFESPATKNDLIIGMKQDVFMLHKTIARLINERKETICFYYASESDLAAWEPVCRNILRGNFRHEESNKDLEKNQIEKIILVNPYELRIYCYIMKEYGNMTSELKSLLDYLCIDMEALADSYLRTTFDLEECATYEDSLELETAVNEAMVPFSVSECNFASAVQSKKQLLFDKRRTFNGYMYESIEQRDFAEEQYVTLLGSVHEEMDFDELMEKYEETFAEDVTEKNRQDVQAILLKQVFRRIEDFKEAEALEPYIAYAAEKKEQCNLEHFDLLEVMEKKHKKLARKEKFSAGVSGVKDKLAATTGNVKGFGKDLFQKTPFGKKSETEAAVVQQTEPASGVTNLPGSEPGKYCPQCGNAVKAAGKFCGKCGYRF